MNKPALTELLSLLRRGTSLLENLLAEGAQPAAMPTSTAPNELTMLQNRLQLLESNVHTLRDENADLRAKFSNLEEENRDFSDRCIQIERQNSDLITMYVASYRLHSTLSYAEVIKITKEIVLNMIGAETFAIFMASDAPVSLSVIAHEGMDELSHHKILPGEGLVGEVFESGVPRVAQPGSLGTDPIVCLPLRLGDRVAGVLAIYSLTPQKDGFNSLDHGVFELLERHAAVALFGARVSSLPKEKRREVEELITLVR